MVIRRYANQYGDLYYRGRWCGVRGRVRHRSSPNFNLNKAASNKWLRRFPLTICFRLVIQNDHLNREARDVLILSYDQGFQINDEEFLLLYVYDSYKPQNLGLHSTDLTSVEDIYKKF